MILKIITVFVATSLSFFLFYFSVPYWTGSDMAELSHSGIWKAFYRFLSKIGYYLQHLCEALYNALPLPRPMKRGALGSCTNMFFYVGVLYLLIRGYSHITNSLFPAGVGELADGGNRVWDVLCEGLVFLRLIDNLMLEYNILVALVIILISLALYVAVNTLFFSTLFGLLQHRVVPLAAKNQNVTKNTVQAFMSKFTIVVNLKTPGTLPITLIAIGGFSAIASLFGFRTVSLQDVFLQVLDEIELVPIVLSFLITTATCKGLCIGAGAVVRHMPQSVQSAVKRLSDKGNRWYIREDLRRASWHTTHTQTAPPKKSALEYIRRKLERYYDNMHEYSDQLSGIDWDCTTLGEDFIQKNFPDYTPEELAPKLVYLCPGMARDELDDEYGF